MSSILEIEYWSTAADESLPLTLNLSPAGEARLWIRSNRDDSHRKALGFFEGTIPSPAASEVQGSVASPELSAAANPVSVVPGEVVRKISVKQPSGAVQVRFVGEASPAPAGFAKAEAACLKAVEAAARFPALAIGFSLGSQPSEIGWGEDYRFDLTVSNPGREAVRFIAPEHWADAGTEMTGKGIRTDIPLARLNNSHAPSIAKGPGNIGQDAPSYPDGNLLLEPGKSFRFPVRLRLAWEPGPYDFQITFEANLLDSQGKPHTRYAWISPKTRLEVKKR